MSWLLANTVVAGALACVALAVGRWCRTSPAVVHGLWAFVLLKLVTPPLFEVPCDVAWLRAVPAVPAVPPRPLAAGLPVALAAPVAAPAGSAGVVVGEVTEPAWAAWPGTGTMLLLAWASGSLLFVGFLGAGIARGRRRLRGLGSVPPSLRREVAELAARIGVPVPELLDDPRASAPCVWSLGRARLLLPVAALSAATPKGRAAVLAHELAHLRRGDHWVAHGELLCACLFWWHPLFWFARARMRLWAELACDAWAVASVPEASLDYAAVLIDSVAGPDSAVPGLAVLAARPAARAAFERRLTMILDERTACRASRAWWLPFTTLGLGLFATPVFAQEEPQEPVRVEIRVNGKQVEQLSADERRALLHRLLREEEEGAAAPGKKGKARQDKSQPKTKPKAKVDVVEPKHVRELHVDELHQHALEHDGVRAALHEALREAKVEILDDHDLRELGIADEVGRLIDDLAAGKGMQGSLDAVIKAAMKGAGRVVAKELRDDPDLRELGLDEGIGALVTGLLENERNQEMFGEFVRKAAASAMQQAKREIRSDADLRELGIAGDVEQLVDSVMSGKGDFDANLQKVIDKAMKAGMRQVHEGHGDHGDKVQDAGDETEKPAPKKRAEKSKRQPRGEPVIR